MSDTQSDFPKREIIVCFLLINQIQFLPQMAINSVLRNTNSRILIGYINDKDLCHIENDDRIEFINLSKFSEEFSINGNMKDYQSFDNDDFYKLVQLKWSLIREVMHKYRTSDVIYSDLDVFWFRDASIAISEALEVMPSVDILIQNFSSDPYNSQLCMGFVAFRNVPRTHEILLTCSELHKKLLKSSPRTGDDEVMTTFYKLNDYPSYIFQLPQSTFPVGNMINNYAKKKIFPGLNPFSPYIFHANFVVGLHKKLLIALIFFDTNGISVKEIPQLKKIRMRIEILIRRFWIPIRIRFTSK